MMFDVYLLSNYLEEFILELFTIVGDEDKWTFKSHQYMFEVGMYDNSGSFDRHGFSNEIIVRSCINISTYVFPFEKG